MTTTAAPGTGYPYSLDPTGRDIHGEAALLASQGPAHRVDLLGVPAWLITDSRLIKFLLTHPDIAKSPQYWADARNNKVPADWPLWHWFLENALSASGSKHQRLRRPLADAFDARRVRILAPRVEELVEALLAELRTRAHDEVVDLRAAFTWRLPLLVANLVLGVPAELHDQFRTASEGLFTTDDSQSVHTEGLPAPLVRITALIEELIDYKLEYPGDDVTSALIVACREERLTKKELIASLLLVIAASHETTVNLLTTAVAALLQHRDQLAMALRGEVTWEQVVLEALRYRPPIANLIMRFAVVDVHDEISQVTFRAGEAIAISYAAAGHDPDVHDSPDRFDITRTTSGKHLSFGHGPHMCVGAALARLEVGIALKALFTQFPDLHLAVELDQVPRVPSFISNSYSCLPATGLGESTSSRSSAAP